MKNITLLLSLFFLFFSFSSKLYSQCQPNAEIAFPLGTTQFCEGAAVEVQNLTNQISCIDSMTIDWGDETPIITFTDFGNKFHAYDVSDSLACVSSIPVSYEIRLTAFGNNGLTSSATKDLFIFPKPVALFGIDSPLCSNSPPECFNNASCWDSLWTWTVLAPNGMVTGNYMEEEPCHTFVEVGQHQVTLVASNRCPVDNSLQSDTAFQIVQVIEEPTAVAEALDGVVDLTADTLVVCLGGGGLVNLDGTMSVNATSYSWDAVTSGSNYDWVVMPPSQQDPSIPDPGIQFLREGVFRIILTTNNECDRPSRDTLIFNVLDADAVVLDPFPDDCVSVDYSPGNDDLNANTVYQINGTIIPNGDFPVTLDTGTYIIEASLQNECGMQYKADTVVVFPPEMVSILAPSDTTICVGSDTLPIFYTNPGGNWQGDHLFFRGDSVFFIPEEVGPFQLTYRKGIGACQDEASITIEVEGIDVQASDYTVCSTSAPFQLQATPGGGIWSSIDCPACIQGDTFLVDQLLALGLNEVEVQYNVSSASDCSGATTILVSIEDPVAAFSVDSLSCEDISIVPDASGSVGQLTWEVDGQNIGAPPFNNLSTGPHTITLIAEAGNCDSIVSQDIYVTMLPSGVSFTAQPLEGCADLEVTLNNTTGSFDNEAYEWYLGDSLFSTAVQPGMITLPSGLSDTTYLIRLIASNSCDGEEAMQEITVFPQPRARFGPMKDEYCSGDVVQLANVSTGGPMNSWLWDYGNGVTSTDSIPLDMIYFADTIPEIYTITLTASNDCGTQSFSYELTIHPTDVRAFFNISQQPLCVGEEVCLTNLSTPGATILWDLGDGNTSTGTIICHRYSVPGTYTISLKAFGCGFDSILAEVNVLPLPEFEIGNLELECPGDSMQFFLSNAIDVDQHLWFFGDGDSSFLATPTHQYLQPGPYQVNFTGTSIAGCVQRDSVQINIPTAPTAGFSISTDSICQEQVVTFNDTSSADVVTRFWNFGNSSFSTDPNPSTSFNQAGNYTITLVVSNASGCKDTSQQVLFVYANPEPDFDFIINRQCTPAEITFANTSINAQSYQWDFGNGQTSIDSIPIIIYSQADTFTVQLRAFNGVCSEVTSKDLIIHPTPEPLLALSDKEGCAPFEISLGVAINQAGLDYQWQISNGVTLYDSLSIYQFDEPGDYEISLLVSSEFCQDSITDSVTIYQPVLIESEQIDNLCFGDTSGQINIDLVSGTAPFQYQWSNNSAVQDQELLVNGNYQLTITDLNGCTLLDTFEIESPPPIQVMVSDSAIATCAGDQDAYICLSIEGGIGQYEINWENGSDEICLEDIPAGEYGVQISDDNNCMVDLNFNAYENPPIELFDQVDQVSCFGFDDGRIRLDSITGGVSDFYNTLLLGVDSLENGRNFSNLEPGNYTLIIQDLEGCTLERTYQISEPDSTWLDIREDTIRLPLGESIFIDVRHNAGNPLFNWLPGDSLSCSDCESPLASPITTTWYSLLMDEEGCLSRDSVLILVDKNRNYYVPNIFTPNADGRNDLFRIRSRVQSIRRIVSFQIFDRWGEKVFQADDFRPQEENPDHAWDGKFRGKLLSPDVFTYWFVIEYEDDFQEKIKGTITLMR